MNEDRPPQTRWDVDVSLITSLYRSMDYLPRYCDHVLQLGRELQPANVTVEVILVANDASADEQRWIGDLRAAAHGIATLRIQAVFVERETVYASWNRGIALSSGNCIGVWGVDDTRTRAAIVEGVQLIKSGRCELVDFPITEEIHRSYFGILPYRIRRQHGAPFDPAQISPKAALSPFFLISRDLYDRAGPFDERFRIAGDFEWSQRSVVRAAHYCAGKSIAGTYASHGGNLSGGTNNQRQRAENNVVLLKHQQWEAARPVAPDVMRSAQRLWQEDLRDVPEAVAGRLWGAQAEATWTAWLRAKRRQQVTQAVRWLPRLVVDTLKLRGLFARLGIVHPERRRH